ncbi:hypothetical protein [Brevundimonas sp.]|uniref:hypothetical protein n=1 Tax=Brevundimonas sp. TaxID=1871086 RepID=UPI003BAA6CEE
MNDGILATHVDETFPTITVEIAQAVFEAIRPSLREPTAAPSDVDATEAWRTVVRLAFAMPFADLRDTLGRMQQADGPVARDAEYAFTWGIYHSRAEDEIAQDHV